MRMLVGSHGANLVNMIWNTPPLVVIEVMRDDVHRFSNYWHLARVLGFGHWVVPVSSAPSASLDVELLWRTVARALELDTVNVRNTH